MKSSRPSSHLPIWSTLFAAGVQEAKFQILPASSTMVRANILLSQRLISRTSNDSPTRQSHCKGQQPLASPSLRSPPQLSLPRLQLGLDRLPSLPNNDSLILHKHQHSRSLQSLRRSKIPQLTACNVYPFETSQPLLSHQKEHSEVSPCQEWLEVPPSRPASRSSMHRDRKQATRRRLNAPHQVPVRAMWKTTKTPWRVPFEIFVVILLAPVVFAEASHNGHNDVLTRPSGTTRYELVVLPGRLQLLELSGLVHTLLLSNSSAPPHRHPAQLSSPNARLPRPQVRIEHLSSKHQAPKALRLAQRMALKSEHLATKHRDPWTMVSCLLLVVTQLLHLLGQWPTLSASRRTLSRAATASTTRTTLQTWLGNILLRDLRPGHLRGHLPHLQQ